MNFLKISGLVIGTGSVVGGTGAGVYYGVIKNTKEENINKNSGQENEKTQFDGKLAFQKKDGNDSNYEIKFFTNDQYITEANSFDSGKTEDNEKYVVVNKVIDISHKLNISEVEAELKKIFGSEITLTDAKNKIELEKTKLEDLFGKAIYENLKIKFSS